MITINIDLDVKCRECRRPGAVNGGLCMKCITKHIKRGDYDHILRRSEPKPSPEGGEGKP